MQKARREEGEVLFAQQYRPDENKSLLCADTACSAEMIFRKGGLTHGSLTWRAACFVSKDVKQHIAHCTAHEDLAIQAKRKKNIEQGLQEGSAILINLNLSLAEAFNDAAAPGAVALRSTRALQDYVAVPARNIEDLLGYKIVVEKTAGQEGIAKTFVNYRKKIMPLAEFILDDAVKFHALFKKMSVALEKDQKQTVSDFPRLIIFKATRAASAGRGPIRGTPVTLQRDAGTRLVLLQKAEAVPGLRKALRRENLYLVALPTLDAGEAALAKEKLARGESIVFLDMHWKVLGSHQLAPVEDKTPQAKQTSFKF